MLGDRITWIQDFCCVSGTPSIIGLNEYTFKAQLTQALDRSVICKSLKDQTVTTSSEASPVPLEIEWKWKQWEEKFVNYRRSHIGANGIPLSYVICENGIPAIDEEYTDFVSKTISCALLEGEFYIADRMTIFKIIILFTNCQPLGDWIKNTMKYSDGHRSMKALRDHFAVEGNASRNMAEADHLKEHLYYKNELAMSFETFLTQYQKMYTVNW